MYVETTIARGIPCIARLICYSRARPGYRGGHPDNWEEDEPEELDIELLSMDGKTSPWLQAKASPKDWERIQGEVLAELKDTLQGMPA